MRPATSVPLNLLFFTFLFQAHRLVFGDRRYDDRNAGMVSNLLSSSVQYIIIPKFTISLSIVIMFIVINSILRIIIIGNTIVVIYYFYYLSLS